MFKRIFGGSGDLAASRLHDGRTFYSAFSADLSGCKRELVIESPFMTVRRATRIMPALQGLRVRGVNIVINTRPPHEHDPQMNFEAQKVIEQLQQLGAQVLFTGGHHRKLAIIDRKVLWEGSLNILSQNDSCEVMRRIESEKLATEMIRFTQLDKFLD